MFSRSLFILGGTAILISLLTFLESVLFIASSNSVNAVVQKISSKSEACELGGRNNRNTVPGISFSAFATYKAIDNTDYPLVLNAGRHCEGQGARQTYEEGSEIGVRYLRFKPSIWRLNAFNYNWGISVSALVLGIFLLLAAPYTYLFDNRRSDYSALNPAFVCLRIAAIAVFVYALIVLPPKIPIFSLTLIFYEIALIVAAIIVSLIFIAFLSGSTRSRYHTFFPPLALLLNTQECFIFFVAALTAKLAKADGRVSEEEIDRIDRIMNSELKLNHDEISYFMFVFKKSVRSIWSFGFLRRLFYFRYKQFPEAMTLLIGILVQLSKADYQVSDEEGNLILETAEKFGIRASTFAALYGSGSAETGAASRDYEALGCSPGDSFEIVRSAYRRLSKDHHPDRAIARGLPPNMVKAAGERFRKITEAYERIRLKEGW